MRRQTTFLESDCGKHWEQWWRVRQKRGSHPSHISKQVSHWRLLRDHWGMAQPSWGGGTATLSGSSGSLSWMLIPPAPQGLACSSGQVLGQECWAPNDVATHQQHLPLPPPQTVELSLETGDQGKRQEVQLQGRKSDASPKGHTYGLVHSSTTHNSWPWKQAICPPMDGLKIWYLYMVEYYSSTKKNKFESFGKKWMHLRQCSVK